MPNYNVTIFKTLAHKIEITTEISERALEVGCELVENDETDSYDTESLGTYDSDIEEVES